MENLNLKYEQIPRVMNSNGIRGLAMTVHRSQMRAYVIRIGYKHVKKKKKQKTNVNNNYFFLTRPNRT